MTTQTTATASLSAELKTYYDRTLLERALPSLVHNQFGQPRPLPRGNGKNIEFRRFESLAAATTPLTEGTAPAGNALTVTAVTASVAQYGDYIKGTDLLDLTAFDPILTETAQLLGEQAGNSMDQVVRDIVTAGTSVQYANGRVSRITVAAGDVLTITEIRKAVRTLKNQNAKPVAGGDYVALIHPNITYALQSDSAWINANQYAGSQAIFSGEIGRMYGVRFVESTNAKVFTGAGAGSIDVYATMVLGANAYGIVPLDGQSLSFLFMPVGSAGTADPLAQNWTSGWKSAFTSKILNDSFMVRIESAQV